MSVARIICTVFEDALQLALPLSQRFDRVEIVEPGCACGQADFEINLQWCSLDEALASVSMLGGGGRGRPLPAAQAISENSGNKSRRRVGRGSGQLFTRRADRTGL
jgi:hypothetical protein